MYRKGGKRERGLEKGKGRQGGKCIEKGRGEAGRERYREVAKGEGEGHLKGEG